jgi:HEAT repeat protein
MRVPIAAALLGALLCGLAQPRVLAGQDAKELDEEAKKKISEFGKARSKAKNEEELKSAIDALASIQHPKILKELAGILRSGTDYIKTKVAEHMAQYKGSKQASEDLLAVLGPESAKAKKDKQGQETGYETSVAIMNAIGEVGVKSAADKLHPFFRHQCLEICKGAIKACGKLKSLSTPDHLIRLMSELEQAAAQAQQPPPPPGQPPPGGPNLPPGIPPGAIQNAQAQMANENARRQSMLADSINATLGAIMNENKKQGASEWAKLWAKVKPELVKKEKELEKQAK